MVVSVVLHQLDRSGGCRVLVRVANALSAAGHSVSVVIPRGRRFETHALAQGIRVYEVGIPIRCAGEAGTFLSTLSMCVSIPRSHLVVFSYFLCAVALRLQNLFGLNRAALYFVQANEPLAFGTLAKRYRKLRKAVASWSLRLPYSYICNSTYIRHFLFCQFKQSARVVSPGVDRDVFKYVPEGSSSYPSVAVIGERSEVKGWRMLVSTLNRLTELRTDVKIFVMNSEPPWGFRSLRNRVEWKSPRSDQGVAEVLRSATVFFSSSQVEGFGLPVLESMAVGTPVVATDSHGVRDILDHGRNGVLVPYGDVEAAARAIDDLLNDPARREKYRAEGLATAERFSWEKFDRDLLSIVQEMA